MTTAVIILIVAAIAVVIALVVRSRKQSSETSATPEVSAPKRAAPVVSEFHVRGDTATTVFAVPLGDGVPGDRLVELLSAAAVEDLRNRASSGLPLGEVQHIEVSAMRGGVPVVLTTVDLPDPGVLPDIDDRVSADPSHDPIAVLQAVVADTTVSTPTAAEGDLGPIADHVQLSGRSEALLRAAGVDTDTMSLSELIVGLLEVSGYDVHSGRSGLSGGAGGTAETFGLVRGGQQMLLVILTHAEGSHPELDDTVLAHFAAEVAKSQPHQAILVTDKYSPYSMYEREKRDTRSVYITRERLQSFVDSFDLG